MSKANYGRPGGEPFEDALSAVREAVDARTLIVPFSVVHDLDMGADPYPDRRKRLARFLVGLSRNHTVLPFWTVQSWETRNALWQLFGREAPTRVRSRIVREGLANAFGKEARCAGSTPEDEAAALQFANSPNVTLDLLLERGDNQEFTRQYRATEGALLARFEQDRQEAVKRLTPEQHRGVELANFFSEGDSGRILNDTLQELGASAKTLRERLTSDADINRFVTAIPTLEASVDLRLASARNLGRKIPQNDLRDVMWLSVAVPYANLVASENYWGNMVRSLGLDRRYGTVVITDARELRGRLVELGCL
jgi:hypothetical protein